MRVTLCFFFGVVVAAAPGARDIRALTVQNDALQDFMVGLQTIARTLNKPRCPEPYFAHGDECFFINYDKLKWTDAKTACEQMDGHLADPANSFLLYQHLREKLDGEKVYFFIGGIRSPPSSPMKFLSGRPVKPEEWASGSGNPHSNVGEDCLVIKVEYPPLADFYCERPHESICEYGEGVVVN